MTLRQLIPQISGLSNVSFKTHLQQIKNYGCVGSGSGGFQVVEKLNLILQLPFISLEMTSLDINLILTDNKMVLDLYKDECVLSV